MCLFVCCVCLLCMSICVRVCVSICGCSRRGVLQLRARAAVELERRAHAEASLAARERAVLDIETKLDAAHQEVQRRLETLSKREAELQSREQVWSCSVCVSYVSCARSARTLMAWTPSPCIAAGCAAQGTMSKLAAMEGMRTDEVEVRRLWTALDDERRALQASVEATQRDIATQLQGVQAREAALARREADVEAAEKVSDACVVAACCCARWQFFCVVVEVLLVMMMMMMMMMIVVKCGVISRPVCDMRRGQRARDSVAELERRSRDAQASLSLRESSCQQLQGRLDEQHAALERRAAELQRRESATAQVCAIVARRTPPSHHPRAARGCMQLRALDADAAQLATSVTESAARYSQLLGDVTAERARLEAWDRDLQARARRTEEEMSARQAAVQGREVAVTQREDAVAREAERLRAAVDVRRVL